MPRVPTQQYWGAPLDLNKEMDLNKESGSRTPSAFALLLPILSGFLPLPNPMGERGGDPGQKTSGLPQECGTWTWQATKG